MVLNFLKKTTTDGNYTPHRLLRDLEERLLRHISISPESYAIINHTGNENSETLNIYGSYNEDGLNQKIIQCLNELGYNIRQDEETPQEYEIKNGKRLFSMFVVQENDHYQVLISSKKTS